MTIFEARERAADYGFAHDQEIRFLAEREGIVALARWAAEILMLDAAATASYEDDAVRRLVGGADIRDIVGAVRTTLERAGKPAMSHEAEFVYARANASASARLHGVAPSPCGAHNGREHHMAHHRHDFWGWTV